MCNCEAEQLGLTVLVLQKDLARATELIIELRAEVAKLEEENIELYYKTKNAVETAEALKDFIRDVDDYIDSIAGILQRANRL